MVGVSARLQCIDIGDYVISDQLIHAIDCIDWIEQSRRQTSFGARKPPLPKSIDITPLGLMDDRHDALWLCGGRARKENYFHQCVCVMRPSISKFMRQLNAAQSECAVWCACDVMSDVIHALNTRMCSLLCIDFNRFIEFYAENLYLFGNNSKSSSKYKIVRL